MQGIERLTFKFKNSVDLDKTKLSIQHPGRMFAPEIIDSTFTNERFQEYKALYKVLRGKATVLTARYSVILMMNKPERPCVPIEEDEKYHFDDCQDSFVHEKVHLSTLKC